MFSHITVGISDFDRALRFYRAVLGELSLAERFCEPERPWAGWQSAAGRPLFIIARPFDGAAASVGNGSMVAFQAATHDQVQRFYDTALAMGGQCEGPPGLRPQYHARYYGAYVRDPDGNKLAVACHD